MREPRSAGTVSVTGSSRLSIRRSCSAAPINTDVIDFAIENEIQRVCGVWPSA